MAEGHFHRSLGQRPRSECALGCLAEGHIHLTLRAGVSLAVGQKRQTMEEGQRRPETGDRTTHLHTTLRIFNTLGQEVRALVDEFQHSGKYTVTWDGKDSSGREVTSGIYFYRLQIEGFTTTRQMILMK